MNSKNKISTMYIAYDGVMQPLGISQVIAYIELLSENFEVHLLSFEKKVDLKDKFKFNKIQNRLQESNIHWHYLTYHKSPSALATSYDLLVGFSLAFYLCIKNNIKLIHARSYVSSVIAFFLKRLLSIKFLFDMRGFWPDENLDSNAWKRKSRIYMMAKWFEKKFLLNADHIISLTNAGIKEINKFSYVDPNIINISKITTCTDLQKFSINPDLRDLDFVLGYVGTVQSWYDFDSAILAFSALIQIKPKATFLIVNKGEHSFITSRLKYFKIPLSSIELLEAASEDLPALINRMHAGVFFIRPTFSKLASAPTKLGEFLGCGVPCMTNAGVGDLQEILEPNQVGIILNDTNEKLISEGIKNLIIISEDEHSRDRARLVAEDHFSLINGYHQYRKIYKKLLNLENKI